MQLSFPHFFSAKTPLFIQAPMGILCILNAIEHIECIAIIHIHASMGVPFNEPPGQPEDDETQLPPHPPAQDPSTETETSSSEDNDDDLDEEEEHSYGFSSDDSENWEDPSEGGILTLVFRAAEHGDEAELAQLLPTLSVPVDTPGSDGDTALHLASLYGHVGCARILIDAGASPDTPDEDGAIPLHDAAAGGYTELVELLLDRGTASSIRAADCDGDTPLHNAARGGSIDVCRLLLQHAADPTIKNNAMKTAAELVSGDAELLEFLVEAERMYIEMTETRRAAEEAGAVEEEEEEG
jgi:ankyrin repeat protein